jgi:hypothetical protein
MTTQFVCSRCPIDGGSHPANFICICGIIMYCDAKCQREDWGSHKKICYMIRYAFFYLEEPELLYNATTWMREGHNLLIQPKLGCVLCGQTAGTCVGHYLWCDSCILIADKGPITYEMMQKIRWSLCSH